MTYARVIDGVVVELFTPPTGVLIADCFNPDLIWVECDGTPGVASGWTYDGTHFAPPPPPPQIAAPQALAALAAVRYAKETAGVMFQPAGAPAAVLFPSDRPSQAQYAGAFALAQAGKWLAAGPWKIADGVYSSLTAADIGSLAIKVGIYVQACFANEAVLSAAIEANPAADITQGWPSNA